MSLGIDPRTYDPGTRLMEGKCSIYEFLTVGCLSLLEMPTETTNQKIGCVVGCTIVGAGLGALGGAFVEKIGEGAAIFAAVGFTIGVTKVACDAIRRNG